jgi:ABC-2 type transport system ATP-binding protein
VGFNPELTGRENVFLNGALLGFNRKEMHEMYEDIVDFAELRKFMNQKLKNYSSGMQVRLAFSIAIRARSDILLIDEVLAVGDAAFQQKCEAYFREIKNKNQTVVLVTHDMKAVENFCDRAMLIDLGHIKRISKPRTIAQAYTDINMQSDQIEESIDINLGDRVDSGAEIIKIVTTNESGKRTNAYKYKDTIELQVDYRLKTPIIDGIIDIGLTLGKDGPLYFYSDTKAHKIKIQGNPGDIFSMRCQLKNIFNKGTFYVTTSLYDSQKQELYARDKQLAILRFGDLPVAGFVAPQHDLQVTLERRKS